MRSRIDWHASCIRHKHAARYAALKRTTVMINRSRILVVSLVALFVTGGSSAVYVSMSSDIENAAAECAVSGTFMAKHVSSGSLYFCRR